LVAAVVAWRIAAAQYPIDRLADWSAYEAKLRQWLAEAAGAGARLAMFPEYGAMELASLDPATMGSLDGSLQTVAALLLRIDALHKALAAEYNLHILAASAPRLCEDGRYRNTARLFAPERTLGGAGQAHHDAFRARRMECGWRGRAFRIRY